MKLQQSTAISGVGFTPLTKDSGRTVLDLAVAASLDPGLHAAATALASTQAIAGDCDDAERTVETARTDAAIRRRFPVETGEGIQHSAAIGRRRNIDLPSFAVDPERLLADCRQAQAAREP